MPVTDNHKEYEQNIYQWRLVRDVCKGSHAVKTAQRLEAKSGTALGNEIGTLYLPAPNPTDDSLENRERYHAYRERANFVNFTGHTKDAFLGMVFRKKPIVDLPAQLELLKENANGKGETLESMMKRSIDEVLQTGRQGLLVDFPALPEGLSLAQTIGIMPYIKQYNAETIKNWRVKYVNGVEVLCLVVLEEEVFVQKDEFSAECEKQYRVLMLNEQDIYVQRLYNKDGEILGVTYVDEETKQEDLQIDIVPLDASGEPFDKIQFYFIGSINNDTKPDKSPLYDHAEINISHYRNSADYEESCFIVGQPTPVITGLTQAWIDDVLNGRVEVGSRAAIALPEGGSATLLQAAPNQMPSEAMLMKEKQMIQIGAKLITDSGQAETAEAAKIRFAGQNSKLGTIVSNVEEAYEQALYGALLFAGGVGDISIDMNKEFYDRTVDPQLLMAKIQLMDRGVIAAQDVRDHLRKVGELDAERTDIDIENDFEEVSPFNDNTQFAN